MRHLSTQAVRTAIKSLFGCTTLFDKPAGAENKPECFNQMVICISAWRPGQERVLAERVPKMAIAQIIKPFTIFYCQLQSRCIKEVV